MATSTTRLDFTEGAAPATPAASAVRLYAKADGLIYSKDDAGVETLVSGGTGGGGGGSSSWQQKVNESGGSLTNFTTRSGVWSVNGGVIRGDWGGGSNHRLQNTILVPLGAGLVYEAEIRFVNNTDAGDRQGMLLVGMPNSDGGDVLTVRLNRPQQWVEVGRIGSGTYLTRFSGLSVASDTWYKVRFVNHGLWGDVYLDGVFLGTTRLESGGGEFARYVGLGVYSSTTEFRNIKLWARTGDLPA